MSASTDDANEVLHQALADAYGGDVEAAARVMRSLASGRWVIRRNPNAPDPQFPWRILSPYGFDGIANSLPAALRMVARWYRRA